MGHGVVLMNLKQTVAALDHVLENPRRVLDDSIRTRLEQVGNDLRADSKWQLLLTITTIAILSYEAWSLSPFGPNRGDTYSEKARLIADQHLWIYPIGGGFVGLFLMILLTGGELKPWIRLCLIGWIATFAHIFWWFTWPIK
jgi:hypothetical protein